MTLDSADIDRLPDDPAALAQQLYAHFTQGDETVDATTTPWEQVIKVKGTATELLRKKLRTVVSADVDAEGSAPDRDAEERDE